MADTGAIVKIAQFRLVPIHAPLNQMELGKKLNFLLHYLFDCTLKSFEHLACCFVQFLEKVKVVLSTWSP